MSPIATRGGGDSPEIRNVLQRLDSVREDGPGRWMACCPAHEDRNPSLSIGIGGDGRVLLHCFAGCEFSAVISALGLEPSELFAATDETIDKTHRSRPPAARLRRPEAMPTDIEPATKQRSSPACNPLSTMEEGRRVYERRLGRPSGTWTYKGPNNEVLGQVLRWDDHGKKQFRPVFKVDGQWHTTYPRVRPLYGLDRIGSDPLVFVVEGEKAAEQLHALGFAAVSSPGGSKSAQQADWSTLVADEIVIIPDADDAGEAYARTVAQLLERAGRTIAVLPLPGLRPDSGDDVVEWVADVCGGEEVAAVRQLEHLANEAIWSHRRDRPLLAIAEILDDPRWDKPPDVLRCDVDWWDGIQPFGGVERGSLVVLAAPPRCYKTSLMLFLAWKFAEMGRRVHYLAGEMTRPALVRRVVSMAGEVSPSVVMQPRSAIERRAVATGIDRARSIGDRLVFGQAPLTLPQIEASASEAELVVVDYLQLIKPESGGAGRAEEIEGLMAALLGVIQRGGTILAAAALNRIGMAQASLSSLRGSSAIEYGAHAVFVGTEKLARLESDASAANGPVVYRCVKQREGEARDLRFGIEPQLGPLPVDPGLEHGS